MRTTPCGVGVVLALAMSGPTVARQSAPPPDPLVKEHTTVRVSTHVYVIPDGNVPLVPNVGIIVGSRGTLVPRFRGSEGTAKTQRRQE